MLETESSGIFSLFYTIIPNCITVFISMAINKEGEIITGR